MPQNGTPPHRHRNISLASRFNLLLTLCILVSLSYCSAAQANWGPNGECAGIAEPDEHCYAQSERNITKEGGVQASIDFADTDYNTYPTVNVPNGEGQEDFVTTEEWITFPGAGDKGWIEDGQIAGDHGSSPETRVILHPFYAEDIFFGSDWNEGKGTFNHEFSEAVVPAGGPAFEKPNPTEEAYNHYVLYDREVNGRWHIYWGQSEVGYYGGGWPKYLTEQAAGMEAADRTRPSEFGRQEVAASDGGEWTPWTGATWYHEPSMCIETNEESSAAGNIEFSTECDK